MELGMIGLGRMGNNMVRRLMRAGHQCVVFDVHPEAVQSLAKEGAVGANSLADFVKKRYASWDSGLGQKIEKGEVGFEELEAYMLEKGNPDRNTSGRQEMLEGVLNRYLDV